MAKNNFVNLLIPFVGVRLQVRHLYGNRALIGVDHGAGGKNHGLAVEYVFKNDIAVNDLYGNPVPIAKGRLFPGNWVSIAYAVTVPCITLHYIHLITP